MIARARSSPRALRSVLPRQNGSRLLKLHFVLTLTAICGVGVASAEVLTNATCQVGTNPPVSNTSNCSINATNSQPSARASIAVNQVTAIPGGGLPAPFVVNLIGLAA